MIGALAIGPLRLITSTEIRPADPASHSRRNGAGEDSLCTDAGRNTNVSPSPLLAANCRRRKCSGLTCGSQHSSTPKCALFNICSTAHSRSAGFSDSTTNTCLISIPSCASAGAKTRCGGASRMIVLPARDNSVSTGPSKRNSPLPCCIHISSVSTEGGQPPPGSSRSKCENPEETLETAWVPSESPRHSTWGSNAACACISEPHCANDKEDWDCTITSGEILWKIHNTV